MEETTNHLEKILLATSAINFMSNSLMSVHQNFKSIEAGGGDVSESLDHQDKMLKEVSENLIEAMNNLGDYMSNHDMFTELDDQLLNGIFEHLNNDPMKI